MSENRDKEIYNKSICKYCTKKDNCSQNIFTVNVYRDKTSMYCVKYEYAHSEILMNAI